MLSALIPCCSQISVGSVVCAKVEMIFLIPSGRMITYRGSNSWILEWLIVDGPFFFLDF